MTRPDPSATGPGGLDLPRGAGTSPDVDLYLTLDGIPGDSVSAHHPGAIELLALDWSVDAARPAGGGTGAGGGSGRPVAADVRVAARSSSASPLLLRHVVTGRHVRDASIHVVRPGQHRSEVLTLALTDVVLTGYEVTSSGGVPVDLVSFAMRTVTETVVPQRPDGSAGTPVSVTWDLRTSRVD